MLPDGTLSARARVAGFTLPVKGPSPKDRLQDWELGGVYLNDLSAGLQAKIWHVRLQFNEATSQVDVIIKAPGGVAIGESERVLFSGADITEVALAFDQNMNPFIGYMQGGACKYFWFDPIVSGMTHATLPAGCHDPRATLDDKRGFNIGNSDILFSYLRAGNLCVRYQRERYEVEHVLRVGVGSSAHLVSMAMNVGSRVQWRLRNYALNDPGALVRRRPALAEIVLDLCQRVGIEQEQLDVIDLWDIEVGGYLVASEQSPASVITQLQGIYFFDVCEYDGKVHFLLRRTREPVATITMNDLGEREGDAISITDVQEVELLRKLTFNYKDLASGLGTNNAAAERRAVTVNAEAEKSTEAPVSMYPAEAKQTAEVAINAQWAERSRYAFNLTPRHAFLTPGDDVWLIDSRGDKHRIHLTHVVEQDGVYECEAITSAPWAYSSNAQASASPGGDGSTPEVVTEADIVVMNLPSWDGSDEIGFYIASWDTPAVGCDVQIRAPGALSITNVGDLSDKATIGLLTEPLAAELGGEYLSHQAITIALMGDAEGLDALDYDELLQYEHLAALEHSDGTWEVLQFEDASGNADGTYTLTGLIRGRYRTTPAASEVGCRLVLLDAAVEFIPLAPWHKDLPLQVRAIAKNSTKGDDWGWEQPQLSPWAVQEEWPPASVTAVRDGADAVTVEWTPRPRLGVETNPLQSQHFAGYRVAYSDTVTADVGPGETTHHRLSTPVGVTVSVAGINSITGVGPASESVPT